MGGDDRVDSRASSSEEGEVSLEEDLTSGVPPLISKAELETVSEANNVQFGDFGEDDGEFFSALESEVRWRRRHSVYREVLESYDDLQANPDNLDRAKGRILSYYPGAWIEEVGGTKSFDYDIPKLTSLILIGPRASGKSSLVNRISKLLDDDKFASERAQISYNSSSGDGTHFLQEYTIPRGSKSFCLYDTRSLSPDPSENTRMIKRWMMQGVRHGELIIRESDDSSLRKIMRRRARWSCCPYSEIRRVNFVIFVVNGLTILKSMDTHDNTKSEDAQLITTTYNCPYLSFRDDKPVVVVTHGDLLSLTERARVRVHLGELLGIHPAKQIFDIPEDGNLLTQFAILDMLRYSLEHADRNFPRKTWVFKKVPRQTLSAFLYLALFVTIIIISVCLRRGHRAHRSSKIHIDWPSIRHMWLE